MRKRRIRLTEDQLCRIVKESVYSMLVDDGDKGRRGGSDGNEGFMKKFARKAPKYGKFAGTLAASSNLGNIFSTFGHLASSFFSEE